MRLLGEILTQREVPVGGDGGENKIQRLTLGERSLNSESATRKVRGIYRREPTPLGKCARFALICSRLSSNLRTQF